MDNPIRFLPVSEGLHIFLNALRQIRRIRRNSHCELGLTLFCDFVNFRKERAEIIVISPANSEDSVDKNFCDIIIAGKQTGYKSIERIVPANPVFIRVTKTDRMVNFIGELHLFFNTDNASFGGVDR